ncbi:MAG: hypothetical protein JSW41_01780 [Candidatus Aenigmatarchaeota archaeon]|nr:MAG: hypothetical protein JSW41_01780 [Candidatus Aenigmarchaeota archaeon]
MNFKKINVSKKAIFIGISTFSALATTVFGFFLRKRTKKKSKGPNYAAGL